MTWYRDSFREIFPTDPAPAIKHKYLLATPSDKGTYGEQIPEICQASWTGAFGILLNPLDRELILLPSVRSWYLIFLRHNACEYLTKPLSTLHHYQSWTNFVIPHTQNLHCGTSELWIPLTCTCGQYLYSWSKRLIMYIVDHKLTLDVSRFQDLRLIVLLSESIVSILSYLTIRRFSGWVSNRATIFLTWSSNDFLLILSLMLRMRGSC